MSENNGGWSTWETREANLWLTSSYENVYHACLECGTPDELEQLYIDVFGTNYNEININLIDFGEILEGII